MKYIKITIQDEEGKELLERVFSSKETDGIYELAPEIDIQDLLDSACEHELSISPSKEEVEGEALSDFERGN